MILVAKASHTKKKGEDEGGGGGAAKLTTYWGGLGGSPVFVGGGQCFGCFANRRRVNFGMFCLCLISPINKGIEFLRGHLVDTHSGRELRKTL